MESQEICEIIKQCKASKVSMLELGDLKLNFFESLPTARVIKQKKTDWEAVDKANQLVFPMSDGTAPVEDSTVALESMESESEDYMSQLAIDDPVMWEKTMMGEEDA